MEQIVTADEVKKLLVDNQHLPGLVSLLEKLRDSPTSADTPGDDISLANLGSEDLLGVLEVILQLSFLPNNKTKIVEQKDLIELVYGLYTKLRGSADRENRDICLKCLYILWSLNTELCDSEHFSEIGQEICKLKGASIKTDQKGESTDEGHIMISYQWGSKDMIKKICDRLKAEGFQVWIDYEKMEGGLLESMAGAVEQCHTFLMAASQKYKDSSNCRLEAGYASDCKKKIIPLLMEGHFTADGWLGLLMGKVLHYKFISDVHFEENIGKLVNVLKKGGANDVPEPENPEPKPKPEPVKKKPPSQPAPTPTPAPPPPPPLQRPVSVTRATSSTTLVFPCPCQQQTPAPSSQPSSPRRPQTRDESDVKNWTQQRVYRWLTIYKLQFIPSLSRLCGENLVFLYHLHYESSDSFYRCLTTHLQLRDLKTMADFTDAIVSLNIKKSNTTEESADAEEDQEQEEEHTARTEPDRDPSPRDKKMVGKKKRSVKDWDRKDVKRWLRRYGLHKKTSLLFLRGKQIVWLRNLRDRAPDSFHRLMTTQLQISPFREMVQVYKAFDNLP